MTRPHFARRSRRLPTRDADPALALPFTPAEKEALLHALLQFPEGATLRQLADTVAPDESLRTMSRNVSQLVTAGEVEQRGAGPSIRYCRRAREVAPPLVAVASAAPLGVLPASEPQIRTAAAPLPPRDLRASTGGRGVPTLSVIAALAAGMLLLSLFHALLPRRSTWTPPVLIVGLLLALFWGWVLRRRVTPPLSTASRAKIAAAALLAGALTVLVALLCLGLLSFLVTLVSMHL